MRTINGFMPVDEQDKEVARTVKVGDVVRCNLVRPRNIYFHKKYMSLLKMAFDHFTPKPIEHNGRTLIPLKNFDEFRKWVAVKAGYYEVIGYPDSSVRVRAKSIAFHKMEEDEFQGLYSRSIDALLQHVLSSYKSYDEVEETVNKVMNYA
ncbi:DUF1367 family protein [Pseudoalteromonas luteoviolacea]|uniref:DUF1367 family protein n=1 Tax=Pseudoalteromonas luteoviolacea TaxID=43657 RepID=UPI001F472F7C|nr:DUF1367 family protein [Pseudoalteromonas luteoviolacea]MCF6442044.1 DUF1367 family protein [Pseudoalteromonas luteoviolacea]